jgi:hypothetical protein
MNRRIALLAVVTLLGGFAVMSSLLPGCGAVTPSGPDTTPPWIHDCGSAAKANDNPDCVLKNDGTEAQSMITQIDDPPRGTVATVDWWKLTLPASLPQRPLIKVTAAYDPSISTPVILTINVVKTDTTTSVAEATDPRRSSSTTPGPQAAIAVGRLADSDAGAVFYVVVRHDGPPYNDAYKDTTHKYSVKAEFYSDSDTNGHTSATATPLPLPACGSQTSITGALSVKGAVDVFQFDVANCSGAKRSILYLSAEAPKSTEAQLRIAYSICKGVGCSDGTSDAGITAIASDRAANPMVDQFIATARCIQPGGASTEICYGEGHYEVKIYPYKAAIDDPDPPGDPNFIFTVKAGLYPDQDPSEPTGGNESTSSATPLNLTPGNSSTVHGRLSFIGDLDTYSVTAGAAAVRLHYKLTNPGAKDGQFPAIPTISTRFINVINVDKTPNCRSQCPYPDQRSQSYVDEYCSRGQCLRQGRVEDNQISNYGNFEGEVLVPAGMTYYVVYGYTGGNGADDQTYDLQFDMFAGDAQHTAANPIHVNLDSGAEGAMAFGWGYGGVNLGSSTGSGTLPRSVLDYDAEIPTEVFQYDFTGSATDKAFQLKWTIDKSSDGKRAYDLAFRFTFCGDAGCTTKVMVPAGGASFVYSDGTTNPWYLGKVDGSFAGMQKQFDLDQANGVFSARSAMCLCLDAAYNTGKFTVEVVPYGRTTYAESNAHLQLKLGAYPSQAQDDSGKSFTCPGPCGWVAGY